MTRISIKGMTQAQVIEAMADYTEADYLAEQEQARIEEEYEREQAEYKADCDALYAFFDEHIAGKAYAEIDPEDWSLYSDWYKDVNGIRPHWYLESLREAEKRAEEQAVEDEPEVLNIFE